MAWTQWRKRSAYLWLKADRRAGERVWSRAQKWKETIGMWMLTGEWDIMVWVDADKMEEVYKKVCVLRGIPGVKATSTQLVYKGIKNGKWWWEWPSGAWVSLRSPHLNGELRSFRKWPWVTSAVSAPGEWDYLVWAGGDNWGQVWKRVWDLNKGGWHTDTMVPLKTWWNKSWKRNWWTAKA